MLLSSSPYLRLCFNSLCGLASVNHLHFHIYYHHQNLALETIPLRRVTANSVAFLLNDVRKNTTCRGFAFQILGFDDIDLVCDTITKIAGRFLDKDVAYNLYATRGTNFEKEIQNEDTQYSALRIFLWPRKKYVGAKTPTLEKSLSFNIAACELAGHLILHDQFTFDQLTEETAMELFREVAVDDQTWANLVTFVAGL